MIIADIVEYKPQKTDEQGQTGSCVAHAVLGCMRELVEQSFDVDLDFDIIEIFDKFELMRNSAQDRMIWFLRMARSGITAKDGTVVKITGFTAAEQTFDGICEAVQTYGPVIVNVITYFDMNLSPKGDIILPLKRPAKEKSRHAMQIIGFDRVKRLYELQNSWNVNGNIKYISFEALHEIMVGAYSLLGVNIFPKK